MANADVATTTYSYDANGNLLQAGGWNYVWDYLNRMLASGFNNSTTTYAYDPSGARVLQTSTTSATYYPNKYYSLTTTKSGANTYATSTNYIFNGDTLLATIDQALYNGAATGSPITRYIHPDHLGSTNAVTDQSGNLVQLMDYYPYGATRIATSTTNEKRQYIGQFSDAQTNLDYLNARYYDATRGQFLSEDPVFWALGDKARLQQLTDTDQGSLLSNPQRANAFSYSEDNPIIKKDPNGTFEFIPAIIAIAAIYNAAMSGVDYIDAANTGIIHYEVTTNSEKEQSTLQAGYDYTMNRVARVATKRGYKEISPALDLYQAAYDIRTKTPDAIKYFSSGAFNTDVSSAYGKFCFDEHHTDRALLANSIFGQLYQYSVTK